MMSSFELNKNIEMCSQKETKFEEHCSSIFMFV